MASKIEKELTPKQVVELLETLAKTPGGKVLRVIKDEAKKRGIEVSLMGATSFRDSTLQPYLDKLKNAKNKSQALAAAVADGDESGLLSSARTMLAEKINDVLMSDENVPKKEFLALSLALKGLTSANTGDRLATARLRELEAKEEERQRAKALLEEKFNNLKNKGALSKESIELMEEQFQLLG